MLTSEYLLKCINEWLIWKATAPNWNQFLNVNVIKTNHKPLHRLRMSILIILISLSTSCLSLTSPKRSIFRIFANKWKDCHVPIIISLLEYKYIHENVILLSETFFQEIHLIPKKKGIACDPRTNLGATIEAYILTKK